MTRNKRKSYQATIDGERGDNLEKTPRKSAILKAELRAKKKEEAKRAAAKKTTPPEMKMRNTESSDTL